MTGRKLYDHFTDAAAHANSYGRYRNLTDLGAVGCDRRRMFDADNNTAIAPRAWSFLTEHDKALWNALAKRVTPKRVSR